jgi:NAD(P)-dependent dehydrogenase (short-subunit alcohol dehydrogenase family)
MIKELFNLNGKTALITGGSSGLGEQFAHVLSASGAKVIIVGRNRQKLEKVVTEIKAADGNACFMQLDITDQEKLYELESSLQEERIDILINSAGIAKATWIFYPQNENEFETILSTNVNAMWQVTKIVANHMKESGIAGSIINISSVNGASKLREGITAYAASKAAVIQMTKALVGELASENIRINAIVPGLFHTPLTDYKLNSEELRVEMAQSIPLGFIAEPSDLDGAILFLASNKASRYVTGSCITVDGGVCWGG